MNFRTLKMKTKNNNTHFRIGYYLQQQQLKQTKSEFFSVSSLQKDFNQRVRSGSCLMLVKF